jgi:hypothetical protein
MFYIFGVNIFLILILLGLHCCVLAFDLTLHRGLTVKQRMLIASAMLTPVWFVLMVITVYMEYN